MVANTLKTCPECGLRFPQRHHRQEFCIPAHGRSYNNRITGEGQKVMGLAKAWRISRNGSDPEVKRAGKEAFTLMCRLIDESNTQDHKAGRLNPAKLYLRRQRASLIE